MIKNYSYYKQHILSVCHHIVNAEELWKILPADMPSLAHLAGDSHILS